MIVVDASVWVSHLLAGDANHEPSRRWLAGLVNQGGAIAAPGLLLAEIAGAVARRTGDSQLGLWAAEHVAATPGLRLVPGEPQLALAAARLAADLKLRGPDAVYVAVARQLNIPLVTWDKEQMSRTAGAITVYTPLEGLEQLEADGESENTA